MTPLRLGYVPEHVSAPLVLAIRHHAATFTLHPYPSGTGHMIEALSSKEIDAAIGLTEGWIAGLAKASERGEPYPYGLVGTYVDSPLCWAVSTGAKREDIAQANDPADWLAALHGHTMGVSRIGSGSYVMGFVMAERCGLDQGFPIKVLHTFEGLRRGVQGRQGQTEADFFLWEHFTSKKYFDNGEIRKIGEIYTPWPSWMIVARSDIIQDNPLQLDELYDKIDLGVQWFREHPDEGIEYISSQLDYSHEDALAWLKTVQFTQGVKGVKTSVVADTLKVLKGAKVVPDTADGEAMIQCKREEAGLLQTLLPRLHG